MVEASEFTSGVDTWTRLTLEQSVVRSDTDSPASKGVPA
jgi:hypothetical protein